MAKRPVFVPFCEFDRLVDEIEVAFKWNPGLAPVQKKKNITALHEAGKSRGLCPLLEVSTKSDVALGQRLSAFSLNIDTEFGAINLEAAFQGSKVFEQGGPYTDLYTKDSRAAKKDARVRESGKIVGFQFLGIDWPIVPKTAFYDWLYISALKPHKEFLERMYEYKGFTDIEFNPVKSINCQARSCALFVSLLKLDCLDDALSSQNAFLELVFVDSLRKRHSDDLRQRRLI